MVKEGQILFLKGRLFSIKEDLIPIIEPGCGRVPLTTLALIVEFMHVGFAGHMPTAANKVHEQTKVEDQFEQVERRLDLFRHV